MANRRRRVPAAVNLSRTYLAFRPQKREYADERKVTVMKILIVEPGANPRKACIQDTLEAMQQTVGGPIEVLPLPDGVMLVCDEEGKLRGRMPNRYIGGELIVGTFFFFFSDDEDLTDLPEHLAEKYEKKLGVREWGS